MPKKGRRARQSPARPGGPGPAAGFAWNLLRHPARALDRVTRGEGLPEALWIYAAYLVASVMFYSLKPAGFPPQAADSPFLEVEGGFSLWLRVVPWHPVTQALLIGLTVWFMRMLRGGRLPLKLFAGVLCVCAPLLLLSQFKVLPGWAFLLGWLALLAALVPGLRRIERALWGRLATLLLGIHAVALALMPLFVVSVLLRSAVLYHLLEVPVLGFWMIGLGAYGIRRISGLQTARAFCAILFSMICMLCLVFALFLSGLVPADVLKALMMI